MAWRFLIERNDFRRGLKVWGGKDKPDGKTAVIKNLEFEVQDDGLVSDPFIDMPERDAKPMLQALVDACWEAGIKPTGHDDFKRTNDAQGSHLKDMRRLVEKMTDVKFDG